MAVHMAVTLVAEHQSSSLKLFLEAAVVDHYYQLDEIWSQVGDISKSVSAEGVSQRDLTEEQAPRVVLLHGKDPTE